MGIGGVRCTLMTTLKIVAEHPQGISRASSDANGSGEIEAGMDVRDLPEGGREVSLWVLDRGPGIPEAHRERVFTPFFTTKDKGTGLGLATVRKVMDAHRGRIEYTNPPNGGARFELRFPVS